MVKKEVPLQSGLPHFEPKDNLSGTLSLKHDIPRVGYRRRERYEDVFPVAIKV